ncbi:MAG: MurR/RpiR family transcriptional regulator [Oscillospiraceae bacterium]|nr:MurR/RpiR family transcriptional regulator [Oscillospiraceae bacterium]
MPREESAVAFRIRSVMPELSKSEAVVADYVSNNPEKVINLSVSALADLCGVSEPTIIRACRNMGYSGYQALKVALIQGQSATIAYAGEEVTETDSMQDTITKVFGAAADAIALTRNNLNVRDMERAAEALLRAKRIYIFGVGGSAAVASDVQHKFSRLGFNVTAYADLNLQAIVAAYAGKDDVVFAISHSGSSKVVVDNTNIAKSNGATVISLSSTGKSPLTEIADISLFTDANETRYRIVALSSRIAELTIIDTLYSFMSFRTGSKENLKIEKAIEHQMY